MTFNDPGERILGAEERNPSPQSSQYNLSDPMRPSPPRAEWPITLRQIIGVVIFIVGAELFTYLLVYADIRFKLGLSQPIFGSELAWLSWFFAINFCALLALWFILKRLGFFPRMPSGARRSDSRWREW